VSFRVIFVPQANRDLVDLWIESDQQQQMTTAVDHLVKQLQSNPSEVGEARSANRRVAFQSPIGIAFEVDQALQQVTVYQLWVTTKPDD
jgi:hypothetical protein